jgi:hypothetical protein
MEPSGPGGSLEPWPIPLGTTHPTRFVEWNLDDRRFVDYDSQGRIIGIEVLDVSSGVVIEGLPEPGLVRGLVERLAADHGWPASAPSS